MKRLLLLRHAKSDWDSGAATDHERPLAPRGTKAARAIGRFMAVTGVVPDHAITSSAVRARTTLELAMKAGGWACPVDTTQALYDAGAHDVLEVVGDCSDADDAVLIVGHQPTWGGIAELLTGASLRMATGTLVGIDLPIESWGWVRPGLGELAFVVPPRLLTDGSLDLG